MGPVGSYDHRRCGLVAAVISRKVHTLNLAIIAYQFFELGSPDYLSPRLLCLVSQKQVQLSGIGCEDVILRVVEKSIVGLKEYVSM